MKATKKVDFYVVFLWGVVSYLFIDIVFSATYPLCRVDLYWI